MLTHDFESSWQTGWCRLIPDDFIRMSEVSAGRVEMDGVAGTLLPLMPDTPGRPSSLRRLAQLIPKMSVFRRVTVEATSALKLGSHTGHLSLLLMVKADHRADSDSSNWKIDSISCKKKNWWSYLIYHRKAWWKTLGGGGGEHKLIFVCIISCLM